MKFFSFTCIYKKNLSFHLGNLFLISSCNALSNHAMAITQQCSHNPISECAVDAKVAVVSSEVRNLKSALSNLAAQTATSGSLISIFAQIDSNLRPLDITGPTNYMGTATVSITITNNSPFPIDLSCQGNISMRGYSGISIIEANNIKITSGQASYDINLNALSVSQGNFQTIVQTINNISSMGSTQAGTLWGASLGTEAGNPLDCKIIFLDGLNNNTITHIFVPIPYS